MNLIILESQSNTVFIPAHDRRAKHIKEILRAKKDSLLKVGVAGGAVGTARVTRLDTEGLELACSFDSVSPPLLPIRLILAAVRPIVAKRLLRDLTAFGIEKLIFFPAHLTEKSYLASDLWQTQNYMDYVLRGCEQGMRTNYPEVRIAKSLEDAVEIAGGDIRLICDEDLDSELSCKTKKTGSISLAVGPERGWTENEKQFLYDAGFSGISLGRGVLRTETACHVALGRVVERFLLV